MLDQALGQHFRGVVAGGLFAGPTGQTIDKAALGMNLGIAAKQAFGVGVLADATGRYKIRRIQRVDIGVFFLLCSTGGIESPITVRIALA
ncbi:hypothetical protein D3C81_2164830 [compost metagenome]